MKKYSTEKEILNLVELFETATISREAWKHAEHLTVALYYITHHDIETATEKMRSGIFKLLREGFKVDLVKEIRQTSLPTGLIRIIRSDSIATNICFRTKLGGDLLREICPATRRCPYRFGPDDSASKVRILDLGLT